ncbi:potassium transporter TrkG [Petroclostridium sp. X23]|uniref:TrkH family potassium uptake protein n=1 Tax=Petroclostridium sp. X23 TaxID=3045146 RepID=UPI0024ACE2F7|nr:potassium transporter TrkG [Petroclostridium sp. X23]WHH61079.1 potassium transporter TrkG [Petroclostridium sp. X23]
MNFAMVLKSLGILLICEAFAMFPSLIVAAIYEDGDAGAFATTILIIVVIGAILGMLIKPKSKSIYARDGFAIVALGWLLISFFGSLPFVFSGAIPSLVDSFFETSSGFTTTGASILTQIEGLPRGILFWRSFTHWVGGMGVLLLTLAILPTVGANTLQIMNAESPGPNPGKLVPKVGQTAKILYSIYGGITVLEVIFLVAAGMPLYDAFIHTFGTVGTGGFSNKNASIGAYNNVVFEVIITVFMLMCGANFALYYSALKGNIKSFFKDQEFKMYIAVVLGSMILITFNINGTIYQSIGESIRQASFQVASIVTTTGYATVDFNQWPTMSKMILLFLMFFGGCAGSTGGSIKQIRILLLLKIMKRELMQIIHPRAVYSVRVNGKNIEESTLSEVLGFFFMFMVISAVAVIIVSLDGKDMVTTLSSVAATMGNIGPGFEMVGATGNYSEFSILSKLVLSLCMIIGRLEIYPILLLMVPSFWKTN